MVRLQRSLAFLVAVTAAAVSLAQGFTFTIIHANDVHSHVEPTVIRNRDTGTEVRLGGLSQAANLMQRLRRESTNPLLLHAGDAFQGTIYFNVYQGLSDAALMNLMGWQAMAVGNHEFDLGPKALADFAAQVRFPVLAANLDVSEEPLLKDRVKRSVILNTPGGRVGVVGAVTPDTPNISSPGPTVKFLPLAESVQAEVDMLTVQGVQAIVLLSHCGFTTDLELATQLRGVDVVVGGHSHTFLGRLEGPGLPRSQGDYPTVVRGLDGNRTLVVQAWEWAKLIGRLEVTLDDAGNVQAWKGAPELVDGRDGTNPVMDAIKAALRRPVEALITRKVGEAAETLDRGEDPKMGYVVADSQLAKLKDKGAVAAFMNPGGVRRNLEAGPLTYGDLIEVQPFNNTLVLVDLTGSQIRTLLEQGAASGRFLIPSAGTWFEVKDGKLGRVVIAGEDLDEAKTYRIVVNSFIAGGGDSLGVLATATTKTDTGLLDIDAFVEFVTANSPLKVTEVNRIRRG